VVDIAALIAEAHAAGLRLEVTGDKLIARGPKAAEPIVNRLREAKAEVIRALTGPSPEVETRLTAFREQYEAWRSAARAVTPDQVGLPGGPHRALPTFVMPGLESVQPGACLSCGEPLPPDRTFRCTPCLDAIHLALEEIDAERRA
jgi:hypothetical protein